MPESRAASSPVSGLSLTDPAYRAAVVELLGVISYGELSAFERLAEDAAAAPGLDDKLALARMAATQVTRVTTLHDRLRDLGEDPVAAMAPFREAVDSFHRHTAPADWAEGLVKAFVGDGLANDFYREIASHLDPETRDLVLTSLADDGTQAAFVVDRVRALIAADAPAGGRLALWGRRLMGEALVQAQRVAADRDALAALLTGGLGAAGLDLVALGQMFTRLTERHQERMSDLGLEA